MLWESLAGRHPFWQTSMLETARAIEQGAPPLDDAAARPAEARCSSSSTGRSRSTRRGGRPRPSSRTALRGAAAPRRREARAARHHGLALPAEAARVPAPRRSPAAFAGWTAAALPFYPARLGRRARARRRGVTALPAAARPRARARGARPAARQRLARARRRSTRALAAAWLVALLARAARRACSSRSGRCSRRSRRSGSCRSRRPGCAPAPRRAAQAAARRARGRRSRPASAARRCRSPARAPPLGLGVAGAGDPLDVAGTLARAAPPSRRSSSRPPRFAAVALALPFARPAAAGAPRRSAPRCSLFCVLAVPVRGAVPLVVAAWVTAVVVALRGWTSCIEALRG